MAEPIAISMPDFHAPPPLRFTLDESEAAWKEYKFNCGPGSICALFGWRPEQLRPHLKDFEAKGYTNPTLMASILDGLRVKYSSTVDALGEQRIAFPSFGLARIQWGGPWCRPEVPPQARYWHTHWVACWVGGLSQAPALFDVNIGRWVPPKAWADILVPELLKGVKRSDGTWWVTHALEVERG